MQHITGHGAGRGGPATPSPGRPPCRRVAEAVRDRAIGLLTALAFLSLAAGLAALLLL